LEMSLSRQLTALIVTTKSKETKKQSTKYTLNTKKETEKIALANNTNYILVWYAFCDLLPGNGVGPFSQLQSPHGGE